MKQKHLYALLDGSFTTIGVVFLDAGADLRAQGTSQDKSGRVNVRSTEAGQPWGSPASSGYTYKAPRVDCIAVGDHVVVNTDGRGLKVAKVVRVDEQAVIDVDADFEYKWIVQRVDLESYVQRIEQERHFNAAMLEVERVRQREELVKSFHAALPEGSAARALFDKTTAQLAAPTVDVPPVAPAA